MSNTKRPFKHGEEGTHNACKEMFAKHGGQTPCCSCTGHECKETPTESWKERFYRTFGTEESRNWHGSNMHIVDLRRSDYPLASLYDIELFIANELERQAKEMREEEARRRARDLKLMKEYISSYSKISGAEKEYLLVALESLLPPNPKEQG